MTPTSMGFEKNYLDDSGVEYAVRYNGAEVIDQIEIERVSTVQFPVDQLEWVIACLQRIRDEVGPNI